MALTQKRVSEQLLKLRELHGTPDKPLPQEEAAQRVGVTHRQWQRWETGVSMPYPRNLSRVAGTFAVDLSFFDDGQPPAAPALLHVMDGGRDALEQRLANIERRQDEILQRVDDIFETLSTADDEAADTDTPASETGSAQTRRPRTPGEASQGR